MFSAEKKQVFIKTKAGKLLDAATGAAVAGTPPDDIDTVRVNNRLRSVDRRRPRRPDADGARSEQALRRRAGGVQVARGRGAARARRGARQGDRPARQARATEARAAVILTMPDATPEPTRSPPSRVLRDRGDQDARRPARQPAGRSAARRAQGRRRRQRPAIQQHAWRSGARCRTPGTACRSARCCCSPPSALPSPSA